MTSQKVTFKSKQQAMEFSINTFVDGNQLTSAEQEAVQAAERATLDAQTIA